METRVLLQGGKGELRLKPLLPSAPDQCLPGSVCNLPLLPLRGEHSPPPSASFGRPSSRSTLLLTGGGPARPQGRAPAPPPQPAALTTMQGLSLWLLLAASAELWPAMAPAGAAPLHRTRDRRAAATLLPARRRDLPPARRGRRSSAGGSLNPTSAAPSVTASRAAALGLPALNMAAAP